MAGSASGLARKRKVGVPLSRRPIVSLPRSARTPDPSNLAEVRDWLGRADRPTAIDLFCGAGGLSLGLHNAGFRVLVGADHDPRAIETHVGNLGGLGYLGDLTSPDAFLNQLELWGIDKVDLVAGGVPCQPFSRAGLSKIRSLVRDGQRSAEDARVHLWRSFVEIVRRLKPRAILLENVPDLVTWNEGTILVGICESLRELGYATDVRILNASDYGVPQHRARVFIVGLTAGRRMTWPRRRHLETTVRMAIGDLPEVNPGQSTDRLPYGSPRSTLQKRLRRGVPLRDRRFVFDHVTRSVRPDDAMAFRLLGQGQSYSELPARLRRYRSDIFKDKYKRMDWNGLSRSITAHLAKDGYWYIHPAQNRTLSVREAARIQTFPDWFRFAGTRSNHFQQIGNAVPPLLARAIGIRVRMAVETRGRRATKRTATFRGRLFAWHRTQARSFPWRGQNDAWSVLLAEICLHRTRADQVVPVYLNLLRLAPTPAAMVARASEVKELMRPLGLHWRAENLVAAASAIVDRFGGQVPTIEAELRSLPGVGDYVANAVITFGLRQRAALIDTNTLRIAGRFLGEPSIPAWKARLYLHTLAGAEGPDAAYNYSLLDLGALVCRSTRPRCGDCPVKADCLYYRDLAASARA